MADPGSTHWEALKWVRRYVKGTLNHGLLYKCLKKGGAVPLQGFVDLDFAGSLEIRKSVICYIFTLFDTAICWKFNLQSAVALSSTEATYITLTEAIKEAIWLHGMINYLGSAQKCVNVFCNNQSATYLSKHQVFHERSKHIDVMLHFISDVIKEGAALVEKISTYHNPADMLTKCLPATKFRYCMDLVNCSGT